MQHLRHAGQVREAERAGRDLIVDTRIDDYREVTEVTVYTPDTTLSTVMVVGLVFGAINLPSVSSWTLLGQQMARLLTNPARLAIFNWIMAILLVLSLYPVIFP